MAQESGLSRKTQDYQRRLEAIKNALHKSPNSIKPTRQLAALVDELRSETRRMASPMENHN